MDLSGEERMPSVVCSLPRERPRLNFLRRPEGSGPQHEQGRLQSRSPVNVMSNRSSQSEMPSFSEKEVPLGNIAESYRGEEEVIRYLTKPKPTPWRYSPVYIPNMPYLDKNMPIHKVLKGRRDISLNSVALLYSDSFAPLADEDRNYVKETVRGLVRQAVLRRGPRLRFESCQDSETGWVLLQCADSETLLWCQTLKIPPYRGINFRVTALANIPSHICLRLKLPFGGTSNWRVIMERIEKNNPGLSTDSWFLLKKCKKKSKDGKRRTTFFIAVVPVTAILHFQNAGWKLPLSPDKCVKAVRYTNIPWGFIKIGVIPDRFKPLFISDRRKQKREERKPKSLHYKDSSSSDDEGSGERRRKRKRGRSRSRSSEESEEEADGSLERPVIRPEWDPYQRKGDKESEDRRQEEKDVKRQEEKDVKRQEEKVKVDRLQEEKDGRRQREEEERVVQERRIEEIERPPGVSSPELYSPQISPTSSPDRRLPRDRRRKRSESPEEDLRPPGVSSPESSPRRHRSSLSSRPDVPPPGVSDEDDF